MFAMFVNTCLVFVGACRSCVLALVRILVLVYILILILVLVLVHVLVLVLVLSSKIISRFLGRQCRHALV